MSGIIAHTNKSPFRFQDKFWLSNGKLAYQMVITEEGLFIYKVLRVGYKLVATCLTPIILLPMVGKAVPAGLASAGGFPYLSTKTFWAVHQYFTSLVTLEYSLSRFLPSQPCI